MFDLSYERLFEVAPWMRGEMSPNNLKKSSDLIFKLLKGSCMYRNILLQKYLIGNLANQPLMQ